MPPHWNVGHMARHQVTPEEPEEVFLGSPMVEIAYSGRLRLVGPNLAGRMLAVMLAPKEDGVFYPITERPASRKERLMYRQVTEGEDP